jgi:hypothetical protein
MLFRASYKKMTASDKRLTDLKGSSIFFRSFKKSTLMSDEVWAVCPTIAMCRQYSGHPRWDP